MKPLTLAAALAASLTAQISVADSFEFDQTLSTQFQVGVSTVNGGPHVAGRAGFGLAEFGGVRTKVDFQGLSEYIPGHPSAGGLTSYHFNGHAHGSNMGEMDFVKVGTQDVWFGQWNHGPNQTGRVAFFIGDSSSTQVPTSGQAKYDIYGKANGAGHFEFQGNLTVSFTSNTVSGELVSNNEFIDLTDGVLNPVTASIKGYAHALDSQESGFFSGALFGPQVEAVAGQTDFGLNHPLSMGFGGTKN